MKYRAFTLIELLVVISIIALLISILLPALEKARNSARTAECLSRQRQAGMAMQMFAQDYEGHIAMRAPGSLTSYNDWEGWGIFLTGSNARPDRYPKNDYLPFKKSVAKCPETENHPMGSQGPVRQTENTIAKSGFGPNNDAYYEPDSDKPRSAYYTDDFEVPAENGTFQLQAVQSRAIPSSSQFVLLMDVKRSGEERGHPAANVWPLSYDGNPYAVHSESAVNTLYADGHATGASKEELNDNFHWNVDNVWRTYPSQTWP
jgi:prepilin-type N-terminal cleavage/methylation domain-containing protein/prepilin-type processing-associated H-X9-DG protein